ncbi:hypothetical protein [Thermogemmatispora sp.]|uniref:hypothetical protein n=1 Tax=Thermogemmatispora sp. TaxID=1968838 RepID=UPI001D493379|nr:hypothetical protein [Thermogemmatispora sp.]MBX5449782.1 hypothetical protein [Thermogemmatispora sp.]
MRQLSQAGDRFLWDRPAVYALHLADVRSLLAALMRYLFRARDRNRHELVRVLLDRSTWQQNACPRPMARVTIQPAMMGNAALSSTVHLLPVRSE